MVDEKVYEYKYFVTYLADGSFNQKNDVELGKLLADGYKPLRETPIGNSGQVIFVLSRVKP